MRFGAKNYVKLGPILRKNTDLHTPFYLQISFKYSFGERVDKLLHLNGPWWVYNHFKDLMPGYDYDLLMLIFISLSSKKSLQKV